MFGKILVCLDGTEFSEKILPCAMAEVRERGGGIVLLHVSTRDVPAGGVPISGYVSFFPYELFEREIAERDARSMAYLQGIASGPMTQGVNVECVVLSGWTSEIADSIVGYAIDNAVEMIAMATHGRTGWRRLLYGSVTHAVAKKSPIAMLVISPDNVHAGDGQVIETTDSPMRPSVG